MPLRSISKRPAFEPASSNQPTLEARVFLEKCLLKVFFPEVVLLDAFLLEACSRKTGE
jgi:hypothetical protein